MSSNTFKRLGITPAAISRQEFIQEHKKAQAWAQLDKATDQQQKITPGPIKLEPQCFAKKRAIIIGAGVSGLTTAYELLEQKTGMEVIILEANNRTGGRCLTLRTGDTLIEDANRKLFNSKPGQPQVVRFQKPLGDSEPYLNAGPGRIPSSHTHLLRYLRRFGVAIEVYVMNSESNLTQMQGGPFDSQPVVNRRLKFNTNGWLAEMVYKNADTLIDSVEPDSSDKEKAAMAKQLQSLMVTLGGLDENGCYITAANPDGQDGVSSDRAGYTVLPGVHAGEVAEALQLKPLLQSEFWKKTRTYQSLDFLWQPTLFQPVGGMDQVQHAFAQQVAALGGMIHLNSPVTKIEWDEHSRQYQIHVQQLGTDEPIIYTADVCFSNAAIPFLSKMVSHRLQDESSNQGFDDDFKKALKAVYKAQFGPDGDPDSEQDEDHYESRFLACTTKVGWQADRYLWQGGELTTQNKTITASEENEQVAVYTVPDSEIGIVPIFGGISWTDHPITQIWYPSNAYHDKKGTLTGCYNFSEYAFAMGTLPVEERLDIAREGASLFGQAFADGLERGVAIAWQNMPHIKGGWAQWHEVGNSTQESVEYFNTLIQGTGVDGSDPNFFIIGDQLSSLPGWQEGAIAAALNALSRLRRPDLAAQKLSILPDTRLMVEGI